MERHCLLDNAPLTRLALRAHMLLYDIQAFNYNLANLWHCPRNSAFFPSILATDDQNGVTLFDVHLIRKMEGLLYFL
jgi:hypothetical protein